MLPLFYFGNISYWKKLVSAEKIEFPTNIKIPKKSYSNRTIISAANGLQNLTIPIQGGRGITLPLDQIEISYSTDWISQHKMALQSAYAKSPFYEFYMPYFSVILDQKMKTIFELNILLTKELLRLLKLERNIDLNSNSDPFDVEFVPNQFDHSIEVYPQVFRYKYDFQPDLSILDLLFNLGNQTKAYLLDKK